MNMLWIINNVPVKHRWPRGRGRKKTTDDEEIWFGQVNNGERNKKTQINGMVAFANKGPNYNANNWLRP